MLLLHGLAKFKFGGEDTYVSLTFPLFVTQLTRGERVQTRSTFIAQLKCMKQAH